MNDKEKMLHWKRMLRFAEIKLKNPWMSLSTIERILKDEEIIAQINQAPSPNPPAG